MSYMNYIIIIEEQQTY